MDDEGSVEPPAKKVKTFLQHSVTENLLKKVSQYVQEELLVPDVRCNVEKIVKFSNDEKTRRDQKRELGKYVERYISALLSYRLKCADAYSEGVDKTSRVPICNMPQGARAEPTEGRKLFTDLKEMGFPDKLPQVARMKSRNNFLMAFRCFDQHKEGKNYFPYLKPNDELLKLPGFNSVEREKARSMITSEDGIFHLDIWDALRGNPETFSLSTERLQDLKVTRVPGVNSLRFWRRFWGPYVHVSLQRNIMQIGRAHV